MEWTSKQGRMDRNNSFRAEPAKASWVTTILLITSLFAGLPLGADEFDPLAPYSEGKPLNDNWQACAASFVKRRLQSQRSPDALAKNALDNCQAQQDRLRRFLAGKIGRKAAENVIALLREKYQSDLAAVVDELRARD
jgi:hypothetical protein